MPKSLSQGSSSRSRGDSDRREWVTLWHERGVTRTGTKPSQRELADHTGLDPIYISKLVRTMEESGFIERLRDPIDSRTVRLAVTKQGA